MLKPVRDNRFTLAVLAFALFTAAACNFGSNHATAGFGISRKVSSAVLVTLDVFSGRPNPSWALSADEEQELARRLQGLLSSARSPVEGDLGYRGFRITTSPPAAKAPFEIVISKDRVTVEDDSGTHHYADSNGIEAWLIEQARHHGFASLVAGQPG